MRYLTVLGSNFGKSYCQQYPQICLIAKLSAKIKIHKLGPEMPDLGVIGLEFENTIDIIEIMTLLFVLLQSLVQKLKSLNLVPKVPYLQIFRIEFENNNVIFKIKALEFV